MEWLKEKLVEYREASLREAGRCEGRAEAYDRVQELLNPDKYCQVCGYNFYNAESMRRHFESHPDHTPKQPEQPE